jgi:diguanylate cyclase (GGDEF)-like protein
VTPGRARLLYAIAVAAAGLLVLLLAGSPADALGNQPWAVLMFFAGTLFALALGFPLTAHSSLDRAAHVAALLVLGPLAAAWVNAIASLLFPFLSRSYNRGRYDFALARGLHNAGMFVFVVFAGALVYRWAGGALPLTGLTVRDAWAALLMALTMQVVNYVMVAVRTRVESGDMRNARFSESDLLDLGVAPVGVLTAILVNRLEAPVVWLYLALLALLVLVVNRLARSRSELEQRSLALEAAAEKERQVRELERRTRQLQRETSEDPLTGLANRRALDRGLALEVEKAAHTGAALSVAIADIDNFKVVNDSYGHAVGDLVLRACATILRRHAREADLVARYGGEEFALALPGADLADAGPLCERIHAAFAEYPWGTIAAGLQVTVSIGAAQYEPGMSVERLFDRADERLYRAKHLGRNQVAV